MSAIARTSPSARHILHRPGMRELAGTPALVLLTFCFVLPILWMLTTSFQAGEKMFQLTTEWIPSVWHGENYPNALSRAAFPRYFLNSGIVADYIEAARIDGAGEIRILLQIILPQCLPALAVLAIFSFRDSWDQFLWPLTVVSKDALRTFPLGLVQFGEDYGNPPTEQMAIAVLATIPTFLLFALLQRWVNRGFGLSGLK